MKNERIKFKIRCCVIVLPTLTLALTYAAAMPAPQTPQSSTRPAAAKIHMPSQGSPERSAMLDAVRRKLRIKSRFRVTHLATDGRAAFFDGTEVVEAEGELQETDLSMLALLERKTSGGRERWEVVDMWTLHMPEEDARRNFIARLHERVKNRTLARELLPDGLLEEGGSRR